MYKVEEIANYFIERGIGERKEVTPMKLQKLLYYAYGWYYTVFEKKLFDAPIFAWNYGPVVESIYHDVKRYGNTPISEPISKFANELASVRFEPSNANLATDLLTYITPRIQSFASEDDKKFIEAFWNKFSKYNALELANATHEADSPWDKTVKNQKYAGLRSVISDDLMKDYFKKFQKKVD